ncbi:PREDICTED: histone H2A-III-like [Branchiostoma belcheri]|uniref:Histone H2A n=1 Tax=Branchiostoma belcheri TaxID=7741 RepID=A0A6P4YIH9_BRABE|nr:PREDICTED: histone H2A-III-like [Branchiostoma belcheri]
MCGRGKGKAAGAKAVGSPRTKSAKAGLVFPVAAVYLAAVLEYVAAEVLDLAGAAATDSERNRIVPFHIQLAFKYDVELNQLMSGRGVLPNIQNQLLPKLYKESDARKG